MWLLNGFVSGSCCHFKRRFYGDVAACVLIFLSSYSWNCTFDTYLIAGMDESFLGVYKGEKSSLKDTFFWEMVQPCLL